MFVDLGLSGRKFSAIVSVRMDYAIFFFFLYLSREFEDLAVKVLNECHQKDPGKAMMIVERNSPVWNEMTCLQIAAASNDQVNINYLHIS